jgi:hypothetical protein
MFLSAPTLQQQNKNIQCHLTVLSQFYTPSTFKISVKSTEFIFLILATCPAYISSIYNNGKCAATYACRVTAWKILDFGSLQTLHWH